MGYGDVQYDFGASELSCKECFQAKILEFPAPNEQDRLVRPVRPVIPVRLVRPVQFCDEVEKFMIAHQDCESGF
jgi:hypothetical protein